MTDIIDGRQIAAEMQFRLRERLLHLECRPSLIAIMVGDDPASKLYVQRKRITARRLGIRSGSIQLPQHTPEDTLVQIIHALNDNSEVSGILVQLPLPRHIDTDRILEEIAPLKDVDGFHPINVGRLGSSTPHHMPCTPKGIMLLLRSVGIVLPGTRVLLIGYSHIVGQPTARLLSRAGATVTIAHKLTYDLADECARAEVIIVAAGCPNLIRGAFIRPGAVVIDVGINRVNGKIIGDVAFDECLGIAKAITPVPGGVGPMTIACLLENTVDAAIFQHRNSLIA